MDESIHSITSTLLSRAKAGERKAWERLVDLYGPLVFYWCQKKGLSPENANDVSQEVFLAVSRKLADYQHETFRGWLRKITHHKIIDFWKKERRQPVADGGSNNHQVILEIPAPPDEPSRDDQWEEEQFFGLSLMQAISSEFSPRDLQIFRRLILNDRTAAEVAEEMKISTNIIYLARSRILQRLREIAGMKDDP